MNRPYRIMLLFFSFIIIQKTGEIYYLLRFEGEDLFLPFLVRALFLVFCPLTGSPLRCLNPR